MTVCAVCFAIAGMGCSTDLHLAKEYASEADALFEDLALVNHELADALESFLDGIADDILSGSKPDFTLFHEGSASLMKLSGELLSKANGCRNAYERIMGIEGVDDFKRYAGTQLEIIDADIIMAEMLDSFLKESGAMVSNENLDFVSFIESSRSFASDVKIEQERIETLNREAAAVRREL